MLFGELHRIQEKYEEFCKSVPINFAIPNHSLKLKHDGFISFNRELSIVEEAYEFESKEQEIEYYKVRKSEFLKYGIYYDAILTIENDRPFGEKKYYKNKLKNMADDYKLLNEQIHYFRTGRNDQDEILFTKESNQNHIFALIKALYMIEKYLLDKDSKTSVNEIIENYAKLNWTGSFNQYTELMNALDELKVINNGEIPLTQLNIAFGQFLNVKVRDIHSSTHEILNRQEPAKFGLSMVDAVTNKRDRLLDKELTRRKKK